MNSDRLARSLQLSAELTVVHSRPLAEGEHVETRTELLDDREILVWSRRFLCSMDELGESHDGNAELISKTVEAIAQLGRPIFDDVDADIRVEHVTKHQNGSRS